MSRYSLWSLDGADDPLLSNEHLKPGEPFHPLQSSQVVPVTSIPLPPELLPPLVHI